MMSLTDRDSEPVVLYLNSVSVLTSGVVALTAIWQVGLFLNTQFVIKTRVV